MSPSQLAKNLILFLENAKLPFTTGKWTFKTRGIVSKRDADGDTIDYRADFDNDKITFQIWIWLNDGGIRNGKAAHNPPHWFIRITDLKSGRQIHNLDLHNRSNHQDISPNVSLLIESGNKLGISTLTGKQIAYIDNINEDWQKKAIEDIFEYEIFREAHKRSIKKVSVSNIKMRNNLTSSTFEVVEKTNNEILKFPTPKTPYQEFVIKYLFEMFSNENRELLETPGIKSKIVDFMIRHYPEVDCNGNLTGTSVKRCKKVFKWSERAIHYYEIHKKFHMEHIVPVNVISKKIYNLPKIFTIEELIKIFDESEYEVIVISLEEKDVLDNKGGSYRLTDPYPPYEFHMVLGKGKKDDGEKSERMLAAEITIAKDTELNTLWSNT